MCTALLFYLQVSPEVFMFHGFVKVTKIDSIQCTVLLIDLEMVGELGEGKREGEREGERERGREGGRERGRERESKRERERERARGREKEGERGKEGGKIRGEKCTVTKMGCQVKALDY